MKRRCVGLVLGLVLLGCAPWAEALTVTPEGVFVQATVTESPVAAGSLLTITVYRRASFTETNLTKCGTAPASSPTGGGVVTVLCQITMSDGIGSTTFEFWATETSANGLESALSPAQTLVISCQPTCAAANPSGLPLTPPPPPETPPTGPVIPPPVPAPTPSPGLTIQKIEHCVVFGDGTRSCL